MFAIVNPVCALLVEHIISCKLDLKSVLTKKKCYRFQSWPPLLYVKSEETQLAFPLGQSHIEIVQKYLQSAMAYSKKKSVSTSVNSISWSTVQDTGLIFIDPQVIGWHFQVIAHWQIF